MNGTNAKKVAFIVCVNNEDLFSECQFYLNQLELPKGMEKEIITIQDASAMTAGYNDGMNRSDAKYKVYLHQDVWIINRSFIHEIKHVFDSRPDIGMLGCIGTTSLGREAMAITSWDTGKVIHNCVRMLTEFGEMHYEFAEVEALDGLLLATQYDIPWREDIFDGWDYYDISQCMEFRRAGYKIVVPKQDKVWCFHDNSISNTTKYNEYRKRFIEEYANNREFKMPAVWENMSEYQLLKQQTVGMMKQLIQAGDHENLQEIFQDDLNRRYTHLKEYMVIADIDFLERQTEEKNCLWADGMDVSEVLYRVRILKYWVKRIEHQAADPIRMMDQILQRYSVYAVVEIFMMYVVYKQDIYGKIQNYFVYKDLRKELEVWSRIAASF